MRRLSRRLSLERGEVGSGITTLDKKAFGLDVGFALGLGFGLGLGLGLGFLLGLELRRRGRSRLRFRLTLRLRFEGGSSRLRYSHTRQQNPKAFKVQCFGSGWWRWGWNQLQPQ